MGRWGVRSATGVETPKTALVVADQGNLLWPTASVDNNNSLKM
ncbi:hypothetical protein [Moorena producens]|nr:hypothetical protein [Moorena producens]